MRCIIENKSSLNKRGQVWIETVVYTLVGLAILGLLLAATKPKLDKMKDESLINQAIESFGVINEKIYEAAQTTGMRVKYNLEIGKGVFSINATDDSLYWTIPSSLKYSEEDIEVSIGTTMTVKTTSADPWLVEIKMPYNFDIKYNSEDENKEFIKSGTPYVFTIENEGSQDRVLQLNFKEI